jgi:Tol biopolymer transport system component
MTSQRVLLTVAVACGLSISVMRAAGPQAATPVVPPLAQPMARLARSNVIGAPASLSADGRYVALESEAPLVPEDSNNALDIYVLDRLTHRVTLESEACDGGSADGSSSRPRMSGDGRWVVFESSARNLVRDPSDRSVDLFLRDRATQTTRRLIPSERSTGRDRFAFDAAISADGRVVAFASFALELMPDAPADSRGSGVFVVNTDTGAIERVDVTTSGVRPATGGSFAPSLSGDGQVVAFSSSADLQWGGAMLPRAQVWVRDVARGVTHLVSGTPTLRPANDASHAPSISADGRLVAFVSSASDLGPDDENHLSDIYVADLESGTITLVSRTSRGKAANGASFRPALSGDGRFVAFVTDASDLACAKRCTSDADDNNLLPDVYLADLHTGATQRLSGGADGVWWRPSGSPAIDARGRLIAFPAKEPISLRDLADDFDLFAWIRHAADDQPQHVSRLRLEP